MKHTEQQVLSALKILALHGHEVELRIDAFGAYSVVSALQLALRHPRFPASTRHVVVDFCLAAIDKIAPDDGPVRESMLAGFDPREDR